MLEAVVDDIPPILMPSGRRRRRPGAVHADKAYDHRRCRAYLRRRGIRPRIARCMIESSARLGRHRWTIERTGAWLGGFRRLRIRYERSSERFYALRCWLARSFVSRRSASRRSDCCGMSRACGRRCCQPIRQPAVDGPALLELDDGSITLVEAFAVGLDHPVTMRYEEAEEDPDGVVAVVVDVAQELRADDGTGFP
jgi:transposase